MCGLSEYDALRATVPLPRVPVRATDLDGGCDTVELDRASRRLSRMAVTELRLMYTRVVYATNEECLALTKDEYRGLCLLGPILKREILRRTS